MSEEWRPVLGFEERYEVSDLGRVRSIGHTRTMRNRYGTTTSFFKKGKVLNPVVTVDKSGSPRARAHLYFKKHYYFAVSALVCAAFHGPRPSRGHDAAHNDGNSTNDRADNLRWATKRENALDKTIHGTILNGSKNVNSKLSEDDVRAIREMRKTSSVLNIAREFKVSDVQIYNVLNRKQWAHLD